MIVGLGTLLVSVVIYLLGVVTGRVLTRSKRPPQNVCECGNLASEHNPKTGQCQGQVRRRNYLSSGSRSGWKWVPCACQQYVGPGTVLTFRWAELPIPALPLDGSFPGQFLPPSQPVQEGYAYSPVDLEKPGKETGP